MAPEELVPQPGQLKPAVETAALLVEVGVVHVDADGAPCTHNVGAGYTDASHVVSDTTTPHFVGPVHASSRPEHFRPSQMLSAQHSRQRSARRCTPPTARYVFEWHATHVHDHRF